MASTPETPLLKAYRRAQGWRKPPAPPPLPPEPEPEIPVTHPWEPTVMGTNASGAPVTITAQDRCEHTLLLGKTGQGKSVLMRHWMR